MLASTKHHFGKFRQRSTGAERVRRPDVIVAGAGLAGLTSALACARRGLAVTLIAGNHPGAASRASAGVLGPSIGRGPKGGRVGRFMFAARDRYPSFLDELHELTGVRVPISSGALEIAFNETHLAELRTRAKALPSTTVLGAGDVARLDPALLSVAGALYHPLDGAVDARILLDALRTALDARTNVTIVDDDVRSLADSASPLPNVVLGRGAALAAPHIVLAIGAWAGAPAGLPRALPVRPVKGEVALAPGSTAVRQVTFGAGGYLVPRAAGTLIGATSAEAGFDDTPTSRGADELLAITSALLRQPPERETLIDQRAGLRPMTPDGYPILGRDPRAPSLIYACGYSRNGVLISPLAADCVAALVSGEEAPIDLTPFSVERFGG
jgi:glycine oxidase